ncbi:MAG: CcmD family protein [Anaerolineae bacterium]
MAYVIAAYTIVWLTILGYIFSLARRQKRLQREVEALKQATQKEQPPGD